MEVKDIPVATDTQLPDLEATKEIKEIPIPKELDKIIPSIKNPDNCIKIDDKLVEIKPTKLKYFRNRTASIYSVLKIVPLSEFLAYAKGTFDKERDSDQILYDFLVAVFDDEEIVHSHYDDFTAEDIEKILGIFGRLNHISEKEEAARKNREAQVTR